MALGRVETFEERVVWKVAERFFAQCFEAADSAVCLLFFSGVHAYSCFSAVLSGCLWIALEARKTVDYKKLGKRHGWRWTLVLL